MNNKLCQNLKTLYLHPTEGVAAIMREGTLGQAIGIVILSALISAVEASMYPLETSVSPALTVLGFVIAFPGLWVFDTLVCYILSKALGGRGTFRTLLTVSGYAMAMNILSSLVDILCAALHLPEVVHAVCNVILIIWMAIVGIIALREVMSFSTLKAVIITVIPVAVIAFAVFLLALTYVAGGGQLPTN